MSKVKNTTALPDQGAKKEQTPEKKRPVPAADPKSAAAKSALNPEWSKDYNVSLDLHSICTIPELGVTTRVRDLTRAQIDTCFNLKCNWITKR